LIEIWVLIFKPVVFVLVLELVLVLVGGVEAAGLKAMLLSLCVEHRGEETRTLYL